MAIILFSPFGEDSSITAAICHIKCTSEKKVDEYIIIYNIIVYITMCTAHTIKNTLMVYSQNIIVILPYGLVDLDQSKYIVSYRHESPSYTRNVHTL